MGGPVYRITITDVADEHDRDYLEQGLIAFNKQRSPDFAALYEPAGKQQPRHDL